MTDGPRNVGLACIVIAVVLLFAGIGLYVGHYLAAGLAAMSR